MHVTWLALLHMQYAYYTTIASYKPPTLENIACLRFSHIDWHVRSLLATSLFIVEIEHGVYIWPFDLTVALRTHERANNFVKSTVREFVLLSYKARVHQVFIKLWLWLWHVDLEIALCHRKYFHQICIFDMTFCCWLKSNNDTDRQTEVQTAVRVSAGQEFILGTVV